jgi:hypothetical protein
MLTDRVQPTKVMSASCSEKLAISWERKEKKKVAMKLSRFEVLPRVTALNCPKNDLSFHPDRLPPGSGRQPCLLQNL